MSLTESKIIKQITILPQTGAVNVQWANQVLRNGEVISETFERKGYESSLTGFAAEVGQLDVNAFLSAFNTASLDEKAAATAALADKDAQIVALEAQVAELAPPTVNGVPQVVTRRQARQALLLAGLLDSVQAAISAIQDTTQRRLAQIEWDDSQNFERQRPLLISLATGLGLTSAQLDQLFVTASGL